MNQVEKDILLYLNKENYTNQRILSEVTGHSLGNINKSINYLVGQGYLKSNINITEKALKLIQENSPQNAIILAAGYGMRMVPINIESPKAFVEVHGQKLIERQIRQLLEVGIHEIYVVVGFLKEQFEYLIDEFGVKLIVNTEYSSKNNMYSLMKALDHLKRNGKLGNTYIVPCDIWCESNPFREDELYSWYMVSSLVDDDSEVRINRKNELVRAKNKGGNAMIGVCYLTKDDAGYVNERIKLLASDDKNDDLFWEEALYKDNKMCVNARTVNANDVVEINTYEQLRELDEKSKSSESKIIDIISKTFDVESSEIYNIKVLKKGMTNRSFSFSVSGYDYIMRIPGEGTEHLVNRKEEYDVYQVIKDKNICDDIIYMNPNNGYKITKYIYNVRTCDANNVEDLKKCMFALKSFHNLKLTVNHEFKILEKIDFYESLWNGKKSAYKDYDTTKKHVFELKEFIERFEIHKALTHIDAVPDNFLFSEVEGKEEVRIIDWEYAGMQDPHVDIAMFCIYSLYKREEVDRLIDIYFEGNCDIKIRYKIYAYIAMCGLLWSNWCEYKGHLGVEFGEYSLKQYRYAKDYYKIVMKEMEGMRENA